MQQICTIGSQENICEIESEKFFLLLEFDEKVKMKNSHLKYLLHDVRCLHETDIHLNI